MNVLSLFDGISCGYQSLKELGLNPGYYFASEVDPYAIKVSQLQHPKIKHIGSVTDVSYYNGVLSCKNQSYNVSIIGGINLIIAGSPCQGFSFAGKQLNFNDARSKLFFDFIRILTSIQKENPNVLFLLENVMMKQEYQDVISNLLGVKPIMINSALVSAQNRKRLYWTNIPNIEQPNEKFIKLKDIVLDDCFPIALHNLYGGFKETSVRVFEDKSPTLRTAAGGGHIPSFVKRDFIHSKLAIEYMDRQVKGGRNHWDFGHHSDINNDKSSAVVANFFKGVPYNVFKDYDCIRKFAPIECERLQTLPDGYTHGVSDTQRYKMIGNGWNINTVKHIFKNIPL